MFAKTLRHVPRSRSSDNSNGNSSLAMAGSEIISVIDFFLLNIECNPEDTLEEL